MNCSQAGVTHDGRASRFAAVVSGLVDLLGGAALARSRKLLGDGCEQGPPVGFDRQNIIAAALEYRVGKGAVAMERIGSDDAPVEAQQIQHFQSTPRLVATGRFLLSQSHPGIHRKDIDQMQRVRPPATFVGSAQGLAVDRHHPGKLEPIRLGKARHKLPEGELEGLRFEQTEHPAKGVVARDAMLQAQEKPQQPFLRLAEIRHIGARFRSTQHCRKRDEQHLQQIVPRVGRPRVRQLPKKLPELPHPTPSMIRESSSESVLSFNAIQVSNPNAIPLPASGRGSAPLRETVILTSARQSACLRDYTKRNTSGKQLMSFVLAIDQGTTSSRAIVFGSDISIAAIAQAEFPQHFPASGWVEHEPEDIWNSTLATCREALKKANVTARDIAAIGITNQRETTVVWDRATGQAVHRAIVWQDRRTTEVCARLKTEGHEPAITAKSGLIIDPYFSGTKVAWILDHVPGASARADRGELMFGTVDCYLLWRLTGGQVHATDATNASRTLLFNIHTGEWDDELLKLLRVPRSMLPEVKDSSAEFGDSVPDLFGGPIAIRGIAGDQQAATIGQACFAPGMMKSTYGTGCFALLNTGATPVASSNKLLTTIAYQLAGKRTYALEGSIFVAGSAVQWLRDGLRVINSAAESGPLADKSDPSQSVYLVPAFVGLGAPYWNPRVRGP